MLNCSGTPCFLLYFLQEAAWFNPSLYLKSVLVRGLGALVLPDRLSALPLLKTPGHGLQQLLSYVGLNLATEQYMTHIFFIQ